MPDHRLVLVCVLVTLAVGGCMASLNSTSQSRESEGVPSPSDLVQAAFARKCAATYTSTCFKIDAVHVLGRMAVPVSYELLPGVTIRRSASSAASNGSDLPPDLMHSLASGQEVDRRLDDFLVTRFGNFLDSHSLQVRLMDLQPVAALKKVLATQEDATGRRKRNGMWQQLMGAGMMMGGSTLTMGLSALAAMAGKALMLSMLSLVLSAMSGLGGGGGGGGGHSQKQTTYEIISKPIYTHGHSHSAELHHETSGPATYGLYGRSKESEAVGAGSSTALGGAVASSPAGTAYISQFPRSLQENAQVTSLRVKKPDEKQHLPSNYDTLLIRNLHYVKGHDGRAKYTASASAPPADLIPSETDYGSDDPNTRKYALPDDTISRSFQVNIGAEDEVSEGVKAGPRAFHTLTRIPDLLVGEAEDNTFRGSPPDISRSSSGWEVVTPAMAPAPTANKDSTPTSRHSDPAFVIAKPVLPSSQTLVSTPRSTAYRAYS